VYPQRLWRALLLSLATIAIVAPVVAGPTISGRVVDPDGKGISQAVVFVDTPGAAGPVTSKTPTATMDQISKMFVPGLLPIAVGTEVKFPNRDQISHHVYSFSRAKNFELPLYKGEDAPPVFFDKAGVVKIGCNIHDWMSAIILVLPNAHFSMTDEEGRFTLSGLQPGTYTVVAWHAQSREKTADTAQQVQLAASNLELTFQLSLADAHSRPAMRGSRWDQ
jgi:plastocyanin